MFTSITFYKTDSINPVERVSSFHLFTFQEEIMPIAGMRMPRIVQGTAQDDDEED